MTFLVTDESGRLARWLRLCGYDTALATAQPLSALYRRAYHEARVVVTRNRRVKTSGLFRVLQLEDARLSEQLRQVLRELRLRADTAQAFTRCDRCNTPLEPMEKTQAKGRVPPYVFQTQQVFHVCPSCQRVYWTATHCERIRTLLHDVSA